MTLYTKIRPKTFDEVKGQEFTVNNLRMQSIRDKFFQVIILAGQYVKTKIRMETLAVPVMDADLYLVDL